MLANRTATIHAGSDASQWHYADTKTNVTDIASRGFLPDHIKKAETWFKGPEFLHCPKNEWVAEKQLPPHPTNDPERKKRYKVNASVAAIDIVDRLLNRFLSFDRLKKCVAWLLRYRAYIRIKSKKKAVSELSCFKGCLRADQINCKLPRRRL